MKTWWKIILTVCLIIAGTGWGKISAGEMANEEQITPDPPAFHEGQMPQAGPEQLDWMLEQIRKANPQKADELTKLRQENPEAFRGEIHKAFREQFAQRMKEEMEESAQRRMRGQQPMMAPSDNPKGKPPGEGAWMGHGGPEMMREWMEKRHEEYMKWLEANYPDDAACYRLLGKQQ